MGAQDQVLQRPKTGHETKWFGQSYLAFHKDVHPMPVTVVKLRQLQLTTSISSIDGHLRLTRSKVDPDERISIVQLHQEEVFGFSEHKVLHGTMVEDQSVLLSRHQFKAEVNVFTLGQRLEPRPSIATKAVSCLLATRPVETRQAITPGKRSKLPWPFDFMIRYY